MADAKTDDFRFMELIYGYWLSRSLWVAAELGLADIIGDGARSAEEIAAPGGLHAGNTARLLRALASHGFFHREPDGKFANSPLSARMREDAPGSMRPLVRAVMGSPHTEGWSQPDAPLRTGRPGFDTATGKPAFEWITERPEIARTFGGAMSALTDIYQEHVLAAHDFGSFERIVDVGASFGSLSHSLLQAGPQARAVLLDLPEIAAAAKAHWDAIGMGDRVETVGGNFFEAVPAGGDLYVLRFILHDWNDEQGATILSNIARVAPSGTRLVVIEHLLPEDGGSHHGWMFDMNMMVMLTGRERTGSEYRAMLDRAGFDTVSTTLTDVGLGVIETRRR